MKKCFTSLCVGLAFFSLCSTLATAQTPLGRLVGVARDQTGAVLPGATITAINEATSEQRTTTAGADGGFTVAQLSPAFYSVKIELQGFKSAQYTRVKIDPGQEYSLNVQLQLGAQQEEVLVTAGSDLVHTSTTEIVNTVQQEQILQLPLNARNPIELIRLQAGVPGLTTRASTAINGGRPTWTQVTQDGINIQDNFIRTNSLDFVPNRPTSDLIGEFSIVTNTQGVDAAGGSSQVRLITPSGTNEFHGSAYQFNRNSALGANSWFNKAAVPQVPKPYLNRNQFGGRVGGPIQRSKLFFFGYYEGFRQKVQASPNNVVPAFPDLVNGVFRYVRTIDGAVSSVNVLQASGLQADPAFRRLIIDRLRPAGVFNNFTGSDSTANRLLNTVGFRFNQDDYTTRNYVGGRVDYQLNPSHHFEFTMTRLTDVDDRTDQDTIHERPVVFTDATTKLIVGAWRWTGSSRFQNELRIGANLAPVAFESTENFGDTIFPTALGLTSPIATFQPQGRDTRTFQYIDNASMLWGNHSLQFGGSLQRIKVNPYNFAGRFPSVTFGFSAAAPGSVQLTAANFPGGIATADLTRANALLTYLSGTISSVGQTFQVQSRNSGYVAGIPNDRNYTLDNWATYIQDSWRWKPNLTVRAGLKWEYFVPLTEDDDLSLLPVLNGRSPESALLASTGTVDFVNGGWYGKDLNNFGPSVGFAWDPRNDGKMSVRGAYTLAFVNEETITVARNASVGNAGLDTAVTLPNQFTSVNSGVPVVPTPAFLVPRTFADQFTVSNTPAAFTIDPNIKQPQVHQFNASIEREIGWDTVVEARYVGTLGRNIWRGIDHNQININAGGFFQDFLRARQNGFLALAAGQGFNPAFNPALAGSQPLSVIPNFSGGLLGNATVRTALEQGEPGRLADFYITNGSTAADRAAARTAFLPSGAIYAADVVLSGATTDHHALQLEARRRFKNGVFGQINYTFGKTLSTNSGTSQSRFEPFLDNARPELERTRADFHISHIINANFIWDLPFGYGRRWLSSGGLVDRIIGGWQVGSIIHWQAGQPFSITSGRGTFNRAGRSGGNPVFTNLTRDQIRDLFEVRTLPDGRVFYINQSVIDAATGRGVGPDNVSNAPGFAGQVFFNPSPGEIGNLQRLQFDAPAVFSWDLAVSKRVRLKGQYNVEFRGEFFNVLNHPSFGFGDTDVNSVNFGRITGVEVGARVVQLALKLNF